MTQQIPLSDGRHVGEVTICLADEQNLFREGVKAVLSAVPGMRVVAESATRADTLSNASKFHPDVLVIDVELSGLNTLSVIKEVCHRSPQTQIVILSTNEDAHLIHRLLTSGAVAFLSKRSIRAELIAVIKSVVCYSDVVLLSVSRDTFERLGGQHELDLAATMTDREVEVLGLTAQALTNTQIGARLYITEATVKRHLSNIYAKLGAVSRIDAIQKAAAINLIGIDALPLVRGVESNLSQPLEARP